MTKHNLPHNVNICYCIYLKGTEINEICMPDTITMNWTIFIFQQELLPLIIIVSLFYKIKHNKLKTYFLNWVTAVLNNFCVKL